MIENDQDQVTAGSIKPAVRAFIRLGRGIDTCCVDTPIEQFTTIAHMELFFDIEP
jgi:hypothetical protein